MMRSMFSGVSGLSAHQAKMDVIGNNVANVNTVGFKSGRVTFEEVFSQTLRGAGAPDSATGKGGTNPMQVGLGIGVGTVDTITTRGSVQRTDNPTDLSIDGDGFFVLQGGSGDTYRFTRAGNFGIDKLGNVVSGGGLNVMGWQSYVTNPDGSYAFDTEKPIEPINLYSDAANGNKRIIAARATANAVFSGNLDASKSVVTPGFAATMATNPTPQFTVPVSIYDKLGNVYKVNVNYYKTSSASTGTTWAWEVVPPSGMGVALSSSAPAGATTIAGAITTPASSFISGNVSFDADGKIVSTAANPQTQILTLTPNGAATGTGTFDVKLDFSQLSQFDADSSVKPQNIDGYPTGNLVTFNVGGDGIITGIYSNGKQQPLGMVALANFDNPAGLQKVGDNLYIPTTNSGDFKKAVKPGADGTGDLNPGTLEMSNVDLSKEFTDMIITQRGFQANSRIITTSDEMLQELVNLKR
ncbi:MAG: flagellar hook protein FlgE [Bacillota bacterium]|nr:flagellar hook protein FlgE [Bacillota bacterium]